MIIATLASLSSREALLGRTIESLAPQVDAICVYANGYAVVPACCKHEKVLHTILSVEAGWRGAEAKLWFWDADEFKAAPRWSSDDIALVCDDDLIYPPDYTKRMIAALEARPGSVACVHGSIMTDPFERYATSRMVARTVAALDKDTRVHIPGTGTMAFRVGDVAPHLHLRRDFSWSHSVDPHVAAILHRAGIPVWSVARPTRWLVTQELPAEGTRIFPSRTGAGNDHHETELLKGAGPWPTLTAAKDMTPRVAQVSPKVLERPARNKKPPPPVFEPNPNAELMPEAVTWIADRLAGDAAGGGCVVELGSGFGTDRLASSLPAPLRLVSVEHDRSFVGLSERTTYIYAPIHASWYDARTLRAYLPPKDQIRAVVVDGPPAKIGRHRLFQHLDLFPARVPMLIDDVHRPRELALANQIATARSEPMVIHRYGERAFATIG